MRTPRRRIDLRGVPVQDGRRRRRQGQWTGKESVECPNQDRRRPRFDPSRCLRALPLSHGVGIRPGNDEGDEAAERLLHRGRALRSGHVKEALVTEQQRYLAKHRDSAEDACASQQGAARDQCGGGIRDPVGHAPVIASQTIRHAL